MADSGGTGGWSAAAAALTSGGRSRGRALTATAMQAPALTTGPPGALEGARSRASRQPGRAQLALPAGASAAQQRGRAARSAPYDERAAYLAENRRMGASGPIGPGGTGSFERGGQFGGPGADPWDRASEYEPTGPMPNVRIPMPAAPCRASPSTVTAAPCLVARRADRPHAAGWPVEPGGYQYSGPARSTVRAGTRVLASGPRTDRAAQPDQMPGGQMQRDLMPGGQAATVRPGRARCCPRHRPRFVRPPMSPVRRDRPV